MLPPLHEWETFYVIIGSSAAALTGLQFVVIALSAESAVGGEKELQAFATPTVVHFCVVLLISAVIATPGQTQATLSWCIAIIGAIGLGYACWITAAARRTTNYKPVFEDWLFHSILPIIAYATIFITGIVVRARPLAGLYAIAVSALLLLFIGIHNAWDAATFMAVRRINNQAATPPADRKPE
jgi:hypothetical protein